MRSFQATLYFLLSLSIVVLGATFLFLILELCDLDVRFYYLIPCFLTLGISLSCYSIVSKLGFGLSEPILIISSFICLYTLFPGLQFVFDFKYIFINSLYEYSDAQIFTHLARFIFFNFVVVLSYFVLFDLHNTKVTRDPCNISILKISLIDIASLKLSFSLLVLSIAILMLLSAPVETYYDNYTRYDHLPNYLRKIVSVFKRIYWGIIPIIIVQIILIYRNRLTVIGLLVFGICVCDLIISKGSRINTFIIILQTIIVYNCVVKKISFKTIVFIAFSFIFLMAFMEVLRLATSGPDFSDINMIPGEFNALFYPSIDLYSMRNNDSFPLLDDVMLFKDFFFVIPFFNNPDADPMHWFWINFHPNAPVAPYTMGPVADSAFYGGWLGILIRAMFLAVNLTLIRAVISHFKTNWLTLTIYSYLVSISILSLKYSIFSYQEQLIKNLLPTLLLFIILNKMVKMYSNYLPKR